MLVIFVSVLCGVQIALPFSQMCCWYVAMMEFNRLMMIFLCYRLYQMSGDEWLFSQVVDGRSAIMHGMMLAN